MKFVKNESNAEDKDKDKDKKIVGFIPEILSLCTEREGRRQCFHSRPRYSMSINYFRCPSSIALTGKFWIGYNFIS